MAENKKGLSSNQKMGIGFGAGILGFGLAGGFKPPEIPDPIKPEDFTAEERIRLRGYSTSGDPMREGRERRAFNRILTNSDTDVVGPSGAFTLASREASSERAGEAMTQVYGQLDEAEDEFRFRAESRLGALESDRKRDLDEYRQQVAATEAAEETARANFKTGLLRSGLNLAGTLLAPATGGASTVITQGITSQMPDKPVVPNEAPAEYRPEIPDIDIPELSLGDPMKDLVPDFEGFESGFKFNPSGAHSMFSNKPGTFSIFQ